MTRPSTLSWFACLAILACSQGLAQEGAKKEEEKKDPAKKEAEIKAGHSFHGEVFNEGPRQRAYLMEGMPKIKFPVTAKDPLVQKFIEQGVGQLHGFWYFEAERSFRQAAAIDKDCPMSYWGMAMANFDNQKRSKDFIAEAVKRKAGASERENMYIDMLDAYVKAGSGKNKERSEAFARALEQLLYKYPDDIEAKAFLVLQLWKNRSTGAPVNSFLAIDALMTEIFLAEPMHPAHHFRIHLWDYEKADKALASSALCGQTSPGIAHMWHMPGHIYSRLKRYDDAAWQQEASARVDHAHMMRDRVLPDQIHNFAHNNEWLIRDLVNVGRTRDAIELAKNMCELPRHPKYNDLNRGGSANFGRTRLFEALRQFEQWDELIALSNTPYLEATDLEGEQVKRMRNLGAAYFRKGDVENGKAQLALLQQRLTEQKAAQDKAVQEAETKFNENKAKQAAEKEAKDKEAAAKETAAKEAAAKEAAAKEAAAKEAAAKEAAAKEAAAKETAAKEAAATPMTDEQKATAEKAAAEKAAAEKAAADKAAADKAAAEKAAADKAAAENAAADKAAADKAAAEKAAKEKDQKDLDKAKADAKKPFDNKVQPLERAVEELQGLELVHAGDFKAALPLLQKAGGVDQTYLALVQFNSGDKDNAEKTARNFVNSNKNEVLPLAGLVEVLWKLEKKKEAGEAFEQLRQISGSLDATTPPFARLAPIAKELGLPDDWKIAKPPAADTGIRPSLDALGPFRWQPSAAPQWTLKDPEGRDRSLSEFRGKPVVLIFFLGHGCLHCAEQLQAFAPMSKEFSDAGLSLLAVSSDDQEGLKLSLANYKDGTLPIPLLADNGLETFKAYRAYDDFEKQPLHGTFVIDGDGLVRWQDISYEPFKDPKFVLKEAKRLLAQSAKPAAVAAAPTVAAPAVVAPAAPAPATEGAPAK